MSDAERVTGAELIRHLKRIGRARGVSVVFEAERGKGSHGTLYFGDRRTTVKDRKKELSSALLRAMLKQLGLTIDDLS